MTVYHTLLTRGLLALICLAGLACSVLYIGQNEVAQNPSTQMPAGKSHQNDGLEQYFQPVFKGDSLAKSLERLHIPQSKTILEHAKHYGSFSSLSTKHDLEILSKNGKIQRILLPLNRYEILRIELMGGVEVYLDELALENHYAVVKMTGHQIFDSPIPLSPALKTSVPHIINQALDIFNELSPDAEIYFGVRGKFRDEELHSIDEIYALRIRNGSKSYSLTRYGEPSRWYDDEGRSMLLPFLRSPIAQSAVTGFFMEKRGDRYHAGIDLAAPVNTKIHATADGVVYQAKRLNGYGLVIKLDHPQFGDYLTLYAHMDRFAVKDGDFIKQGQLIGYVGMTGRTTGPHVHYEIQERGSRINPMDFHIGPVHILEGASRMLFEEEKQKWHGIFAEGSVSVNTDIQKLISLAENSCTFGNQQAECTILPNQQTELSMVAEIQ